MSKKIAQLTKVIFHLHSKNEENSTHTENLTRAYEREIEHILKEANSLLTRHKEAIEKQKALGDPSEMMRELAQKHDDEKRRTQHQFDEFKRKTNEKELELLKVTNQRVEGMKLEVMDAKAKFDRKIEMLGKELKENKRANEAIEELKRKHQMEIEKYVREHNLKYNQLIGEKMQEEDKLREQFAKEKKQMEAAFEKKLAEALKERTAEERTRAERRLNECQEEWARNLKQMELQWLAARDKVVKEMNEKLAKLGEEKEAEKEVFEARIEQLEREKARLKHELDQVANSAGD